MSGTGSKRRLSIFLILFAISFFFVFVNKLKTLEHKGIHPDVSIVLSPARGLLAQGNLKNAAFSVPMPVIRSYVDAKKENKQHQAKMPAFSYNYIGPILYYLPFLSIFGSNDVTPFYWGQALIFLLFAIAFLFFKVNAEQRLFALVLLTLSSLFCYNESFLDCPTQIHLFLMMTIVWRMRSTLAEQPLLFGALSAVTYQFRPEILALFMALSLWVFIGEKKAYLKNFLISLASLLIVHLAFLSLRFALGAAPGTEHLLLVLGTDILVARNQMSENLKVFYMSDLMNIRGLMAIAGKIVNRAVQFFSLRHALTWRPEIMISWILFGLNSMFYARMNDKEKKDTLAVLVFLVLVFCLAAIGWNDQRYFDVFAVIIILYAVDNIDFYKRVLNPNSKLMTSICMIVILVFVSFNNYTTNILAGQYKDEENMRKYGEALKKTVPVSARVLSNKCHIWNWYAEGESCVFSPSMLIDKQLALAFKPEAVIQFGPFKSKKYQVPDGLEPDISLMQKGYSVMVFK